MNSNKMLVVAVALACASFLAADCAPTEQVAGAMKERDAQELLIGSLQEARAVQSEPQQEESYQRVYEAFTKLVQSVSNNSLGNARRLVTRLNQLVGADSSQASSTTSTTPAPVEQVRRQQLSEEQQKTEQILQRLDQVNKQTDQHTLRLLQDDVNRLVGSLSESYLRNLRRVIERVNKTIGGSSQSIAIPQTAGVSHQMGDRFEQGDGPRQPGFPGWDELITAVDRMQKSLANFVRSSTKLITAGR